MVLVLVLEISAEDMWYVVGVGDLRGRYVVWCWCWRSQGMIYDVVLMLEISGDEMWCWCWRSQVTRCGVVLV